MAVAIQPPRVFTRIVSQVCQGFGRGSKDLGKYMASNTGGGERLNNRLPHFATDVADVAKQDVQLQTYQRMQSHC